MLEMATLDPVKAAVFVDSAALVGSDPIVHDPVVVGEWYCPDDHEAGEKTDYADGAISIDVEYTSVIWPR